MVAAAVLAVGLEAGDWHVRLWPYISLCKKIVLWGAFFFAPGSAFLLLGVLFIVRPLL